MIKCRGQMNSSIFLGALPLCCQIFPFIFFGNCFLFASSSKANCGASYEIVMQICMHVYCFLERNACYSCAISWCEIQFWKFYTMQLGAIHSSSSWWGAISENGILFALFQHHERTNERQYHVQIWQKPHRLNFQHRFFGCCFYIWTSFCCSHFVRDSDRHYTTWIVRLIFWICISIAKWEPFI